MKKRVTKCMQKNIIYVKIIHTQHPRNNVWMETQNGSCESSDCHDYRGFSFPLFVYLDIPKHRLPCVIVNYFTGENKSCWGKWEPVLADVDIRAQERVSSQWMKDLNPGQTLRFRSHHQWCSRKTKARLSLKDLTDFIFLGSKISEDSDCSHEIKRCLFIGRKAMTNLDSVLKSRGITLPTKVYIVKGMVFPVVMYWNYSSV